MPPLTCHMTHLLHFRLAEGHCQVGIRHDLLQHLRRGSNARVGTVRPGKEYCTVVQGSAASTNREKCLGPFPCNAATASFRTLDP